MATPLRNSAAWRDTPLHNASGSMGATRALLKLAGSVSEGRRLVRRMATNEGGGGLKNRRRVGVTYVLHSPLQNSEYLCIQGLESLRT